MLPLLLIDVALGNKQQKYAANYVETSAPGAYMTTVCLVISLATSQDCPLHQIDVKNVFLHGDLKEEIYMNLPPSLSSPSLGVCNLKKSS